MSVHENNALLATLLAGVRKNIAYKGLLYKEYAKDTKGIDQHIWQAKSVAMFEALKETQELWQLLEPYEKKQPALKLVKNSGLVVQNPEMKAVEGTKSGIKAQLRAVNKESKS